MSKRKRVAALLALLLPFVALAPSRWPRPLVVIDPGHGGKDPGATVAGVEEKEVNLAIAARIKELASGGPLEVVLTRSSDRYVDLLDRLRFAESLGAALYLSVHANACSDPEVRGVETYVDNTRSRDDPSWRLARLVQEAICRRTGAPDRGVRTQLLYLRHTRLPAVLVETGYLTNPGERALLLDPDYQDRIARGILEGIEAFLGLDGP